MTGDRLERMERLARALRIHLDRRDGGEHPTADELLMRHPDVADLLEPMLRGDVEAAEAAPSPDPRDRTEPERILGDYWLGREIGRGGMGIVYEAEQLSLTRRVALKVLPPHVALDERAVLRFHREAEVAAHLVHDGIVRILDVGSDHDAHFIAMEYVDGLPLNRIVTSAKSTGVEQLSHTAMASIVSAAAAPPEPSAPEELEEPVPAIAAPTWTKGYLETVVDIVLQVAEALQCAHDGGVVHRDVKPANILVRRDGRAVVTDFGIARQEGLPSVTVTGDFAGTPHYVSPEQAMAKRVPVDHRADVYSLGVTLYELTTLQRPFEGETSQEVFAKIVGKEPRDPCRVNPYLAPDLGAVILKAIEKDPDRRYPSAKAFADDLRAFLAYQPVSARRNPWHLRLRKWVRREPLKAALVGTVGVALVALGVVTGVFVKEVIAAERKASAEWSRAEKALSDFRLLATAVELDQVKAAADELYPAWPEVVPAMQDWLGRRARPLAEQLPHLRERLDRLRTDALGYSEDDARRDRETHPEYEELVDTERSAGDMRKKLAELSADDSEMREQLEASLGRMETTIAKLTPVVITRRTYRFTDGSRQFLHDRLARLVEDLAAFGSESGPIPQVERRLAWAEGLRQRSLIEPAARWKEAVEAIRTSDGVTASEDYAHLELAPQLGLVPLGMDPESKLWEFVHLASGEEGAESPERDPETGRLQVTGPCGVVLVLIPAGMFTMGAQSENPDGPNYDPLALPEEATPHEVTLGPFFIAKHEFTQGQWWRLSDDPIPAFYNETRNARGGDQFDYSSPVERVSWETAVQLVSNWGLDLPTEAQWEYACRANSVGPWHSGVGKESLQGYANLSDRFAGSRSSWTFEECLDDGHMAHAKVGSFLPNAFGLHDMHGNVGEWVKDGNTAYLFEATGSDGIRLQGPRYSRGIRGGNFMWLARHARTTNRYAQHKSYKGALLGFRAARPILPEER